MIEAVIEARSVLDRYTVNGVVEDKPSTRLAAALLAAHTEIERLAKTLDDASYEDGDHLPKECRRMIETFWGEMAMHREAAPKLKAEIERLRKLLIQACDIGKYVATEHTGKSENLDRLAAIRAEVKP